MLTLHNHGRKSNFSFSNAIMKSKPHPEQTSPLGAAEGCAGSQVLSGFSDSVSSSASLLHCLWLEELQLLARTCVKEHYTNFQYKSVMVG